MPTNKTPSLEYNTYKCMKSRCYYQKNDNYKYYGGQGVTICDRWLGKNGFKNFCEDMGKRPSKKHTIHKGPNDKIYCKENCKWATGKEQARDKTDTHWITYDGKTKSIAEWAEDIGVSYSLLILRINKYKWSLDKVFTKPSKMDKKEFNGQIHSLKEWAKIYNIEYGTLCNRLNHLKWSLEKALTEPRQKGENNKKRKYFEYDNKKLTIDEWSIVTGIKKYTLWNRIKSGWSIERVLTEPSRNKGNKNVN